MHIDICDIPFCGTGWIDWSVWYRLVSKQAKTCLLRRGNCWNENGKRTRGILSLWETPGSLPSLTEVLLKHNDIKKKKEKKVCFPQRSITSIHCHNYALHVHIHSSAYTKASICSVSDISGHQPEVKDDIMCQPFLESVCVPDIKITRIYGACCNTLATHCR